MSAPTVVPITPLDPGGDAGVLRKALKGSGVDHDAIIHLLTNRTSDQRQEIIQHYNHCYGQDLLKDLKHSLSGDFQLIILALMTPVHEYLAKEINRAFKSRGAKERTLVEILCTRDNSSIRAIKESYFSLYNKSLEDILKQETTGSFQELLTALCSCGRDEGECDPELALDIAQQLYLAGEGQRGTNESELRHILTSYSQRTLRKVFQEYNKLAGRTLGDVLEDHLTGEALRGMEAVYSSIQNPSIFFAHALHASMAGLGTRDRTLIRLVVSRCELDMADIKVQYHNIYGKSLEKYIKSDTSGDYRKTLLALIAA